MSTNQPTNAAATHPAPEPPLPTREEFDRLVKQAESGAEGALDAVRQVLQQQPALKDALCDIAGLSRMSLVRALSGDHPVLQQAFLLRAAELETELVGQDPTALERLAAQQVVDCWLALQISNLSTAPYAASKTPARQSTNLNHIHRRFDNAVKCLLKVRREQAAAQSAAGMAASRSGSRQKQSAGVSAVLTAGLPLNRCSRFLSLDAEGLEAVN